MASPKPKQRRESNSPAKRRRHHIPRVLLLVDTAGAHGRGIVEGIGRYALENGPWSIKFEYRALESPPPQWLKGWRGDGIISRTINFEQARLLRATKLPVVELHGHPKIGLDHVRVDFDALGQMVVEHFMNCGLRNIGFFSFGEAWWISVHREAICQAANKQDCDCHSYQPPTSDQSVPVWHESQRTGLVKWLRSLPRPIGIYTPGDLHSVRLLDICHEFNIAVPEEIAILGLGNDRVICETVRPTLSSLDENALGIGYEAARLLDQMMAGKTPKVPVFVPPNHVVVRQSTDLMAIEDTDVTQAVRYIRDFGCKGIDVSDVVEHVGLSRRGLERRFRRHLGRSPKTEISRVQIEYAKTLLARTDYTSESIARKAGFVSPQYFTTVFRRMTGMNPQAYRKKRVLPHGPDKTDKR